MSQSPDRYGAEAAGGSNSRGTPVDREVAEQAFRFDATSTRTPTVGPPAVRRPGEIIAAAVLLFVSAAFRALAGVAALFSPTEGYCLSCVTSDWPPSRCTSDDGCGTVPARPVTAH